jgi:glycosyltransferase involved in cell wall biosynthesis
LAKDKLITLVPLPYKPKDPRMGEEQAEAAIAELAKKGVKFDPDKTVWLGHDRISGQAALTAREKAGGRSALIHHMSYDHYESFAENAQTANEKRDHQESLFEQADILMAVGPTLRDALQDMVPDKEHINMLIPGLADIEPNIKAPNTFSMFVSGRLSQDALKVKQGQLALAAFAQCYKQANVSGQPAALVKRPKLVMRGVDFDLTGQTEQEQHFAASEQNLQKFAQQYAGAVINLQPLPYTTDRKKLFKDLKNASVAAMPSWHEGFGLVGWEAISAGVPLILSKDSGVYELIAENHSGLEDALVESVQISGDVEDPYFCQKDLDTVCAAINKIAQDPAKARQRALRLRSEMMEHYTWANCAEDVAGFFDWPISKGQVVQPQAQPSPASTSPPAVIGEQSIPGYEMPKAVYDANRGSAISILLRSSEEVVSFDPLRQPELDKLLEWSTAGKFPITLRLLKGEGGTGKTRLATQLCHELAKQNWTVGFLQRNQQQKQLAATWQGLKASNKPCLVVVDYAETQSDELINLLKFIINSGEHQNMCLLLLARDGGDWWDNLPAKDASTEDLLFGAATLGPYLVPPLYQEKAQREQGYLNALNAFSTRLKLDKTTVIPDLSADHFEKPLYIQMAALLALHGEQPTSADGITKAILTHEQRY